MNANGMRRAARTLPEKKPVIVAKGNSKSATGENKKRPAAQTTTRKSVSKGKPVVSKSVTAKRSENRNRMTKRVETVKPDVKPVVKKAPEPPKKIVKPKTVLQEKTSVENVPPENGKRKRAKIVSGAQFGHLQVIKPSQAGENVWICSCDCGELTVAREDSLLLGKRTDCGCRRKMWQQKLREDVEQATLTKNSGFWRNPMLRNW